MTVAEYMFEFIQKKGCTTVYMVSGSSSMWLTDALKRNEHLNAVCCHHEQAAAMAADGYGRVNQIPGVCLVTIGPGATNTITGVAQAFLDSSPIFVFSGQANSRLLQYEEETGIRQLGTQSLNLRPIVSSITKYFAAVMRPETIRYHMERAYYEATNGRKGPVWIDVPVNIQNSRLPDSMEGFEPEKRDLQTQDDMMCDKVAELIQNSKRPLILAGYGVRSAGVMPELEEISRKAGIPIVTSRGGIDVVESDNPLYVGRPGAYGDRASHFAIRYCDLLLVLGSRLSTSTIGYYPQRLAPDAVKVMVDIDRMELEKGEVPIDYMVCGELRPFVEGMLQELGDREIPGHKEWIQYCVSMKKKYPVVEQKYKEEKPVNAYWFTQELSDLADENANIIVDTGSVCNIVSQSWHVRKGQRYLISGGLSCMGFWATSIGTCQKGRQVIALSGDGSVQMNIQELATLQYNRLPVKLFVYNNNGYMLIRHNQHNYMEDRFLGVGPDSGVQTPDFVKVASAYGMKTFKITQTGEIREKIREVLAYQGPVLCEVKVQEFAPILPRIASKVMPDGSLKAAEFEDLFPFLDAAEMEENRPDNYD